MIEGARTGIKFNQPRKIFTNTVLNSMGRRSQFLGNYGGVIALMLSINDAMIESYRGYPDPMNTWAAAVLTGVMFKATCKFYFIFHIQ